MNIEIIRPKLLPRQVWEKYGFPLVSKEQSDRIHDVQLDPTTKTARMRMEDKGRFIINKKWRWLINEPYQVSDMCCIKLKKEPFHRYEKETGRHPIIGTMASESMMRQGQYLRAGGCNQFNLKSGPKSLPLSIWMEEDVWTYIEKFKLQIADIYNKGMLRTGCAACAYGSHHDDDTRFRLLLELYPKFYEMVMNYTNNGVTFREALRKVIATNGLYLPDEKPN